MNPLLLPGIVLGVLLLVFIFLKSILKLTLIGVLGYCAYRVNDSEQKQPTKGILLFCILGLVLALLFMPSVVNAIFTLSLVIIIALYFLED